MRGLFDFIGGAMAVFGVLFMLASLGMPGAGVGGGGTIFLFGLCLTAAGLIVCRTANRKTCPQCAEAVKYSALKCKHCGSEWSQQAS